MSFIKNLLGLKGWEELENEAQALFEQGQFGAAKLAFERAADKMPPNKELAGTRIQSRIDECYDGLAQARVTIGLGHLEAGAEDLARTEFLGAVEVSVTDEVREEAQAALDKMDRDDAQRVVEEHDVEPTDEERLALLAGSWDEAQSLEYDRCDERLPEALLAYLDGSFGDSIAILEALIAEAEFPRFLYLELGRARLALALSEPSSDPDGGPTSGSDDEPEQSEELLSAAEADLRMFLSELEAGDGEDARLGAHIMLAHIADARDDEEAAMEEYSAAADAMPSDSRVFLEMGRYFRGKGYDEEALPILESARDLMSVERPDWRVLHELGVVQRALGKNEDAIASLEGVIAIFAEHRFLDFPPATARALAELHEEDGRLDRAADLYRSLAEGSDTDNHYLYYREAARLLRDLGILDDSHSFAQRAAGLAQTDEERTAVEALLTDPATP